ncbi:MAG: hypothetical protein P8Y91_04310 [Desulfuromonadales bacterium]|jgi:hypothetical protein
MRLQIILIAILSVLLTTGSAVAGETYRCIFGQQERIISVVYPKPDQTLPCEVHYEKDGQSEILWQAENEAGYCEEKARDFVEEQRAWGWICLESREESNPQ